jgi:hypothetical protein
MWNFTTLLAIQMEHFKNCMILSSLQMVKRKWQPFVNRTIVPDRE